MCVFFNIHFHISFSFNISYIPVIFLSYLGAKEAFGFSLLDIVKHAVGTVIACLGDEDRLSLVAFSATSETIFDLVQMNEAGYISSFYPYPKTDCVCYNTSITK